MITGSVLFLLFEWFIRLGMLVVVTRRRRLGSAMAWLLVIFFEPIIGWVLYLMIGNYRLPRRRLTRHRRLLQELREVSERFQGHPHVVHPDLSARLATTVRLAERLGYMPILGGNAVELIAETDAAVNRIVADLDAAQHHAHLLFYIWGDDETGRRVGNALVRAAGRGVKCRVLVDGVGSARMLKRLAPRLIAQGVEVHPALPVNPFRRRMARVDLRNHRKLVVIDGRIGYTGSQNLINASYGHKDLAWHDLMARLTGPVVLELQAVFLQDWYFETDAVLEQSGIFPEPELAGEIPIQTLPSGPNYTTENYQRMVVDAVHEAQRYVTITTPYFVPDEPFLQALETAVQTGVTVTLIVPRRCDQILVGAATRAYYRDLLEAGVRIFLYEECLLHAKTMTIDDEIAFFGTSNFDIRSFTLDFEINLILYGAEATRQLRLQQEEYLKQSTRLTLEDWEKRPAPQKVFQNVTKLLSPLL